MAEKGHNSQDNANTVADAVLHSYYSHTFMLGNIHTIHNMHTFKTVVKFFIKSRTYTFQMQ